eukprot:c5369_g1_i1.p1 GENE.c5369_g1_i1~~c5369_g1_i1.p1  ORF type:complete len:207 (+),score=72.93 c5369_g1_i1:33-623(+)
MNNLNNEKRSSISKFFSSASNLLAPPPEFSGSSSEAIVLKNLDTGDLFVQSPNSKELKQFFKPGPTPKYYHIPIVESPSGPLMRQVSETSSEKAPSNPNAVTPITITTQNTYSASITSSISGWSHSFSFRDVAIDGNCAVCQNPFSKTCREHYCRICGRIVCGSCSSGKLILQGVFVRSCDECHAFGENGLAQVDL